MANRQTYVIGALGVLVGMVVGANSAQNATMVSFSGTDPNSEVIQNMPNLRRASGILRWRSDENPGGTVYSRTVQRYTQPRRVLFGEGYIGTLRDNRVGDTRVFQSAPTVRGGSAMQRQGVPECDEFSGQRYTRCLEALINGEPYEANYFPTSY
ncbi:MAG: hypothetical protein KC680_00915 [Candidatus Peregrinibacteria bacterium]|nr:hypothetical protein [Candidatus Peregrinibacteria bacterium]MCB9808169.1 hypothetical protein [Candidatus Peribacteria bacterium]